MASVKVTLNEDFDMDEYKRTLVKNLFKKMYEEATESEIDSIIDSIDVDKLLKNKAVMYCAVNLEASSAKLKHRDS